MLRKQKYENALPFHFFVLLDGFLAFAKTPPLRYGLRILFSKEGGALGKRAYDVLMRRFDGAPSGG